jgi:hypothetical protein
MSMNLVLCLLFVLHVSSQTLRMSHTYALPGKFLPGKFLVLNFFPVYVYLIWFTFISDADFISLFPAPDRCVSPRAWEASVRWHGAVSFAFYYNRLRLTSSYPFIMHCDFQDIINVFDYISVIIFYELINFRSRYLSSCDWRGLIAVYLRCSMRFINLVVYAGF